MKKIFKYMFVALMATATMTMVGCSKDDDDNNNNNPVSPETPTIESLAGTEWEGTYNTVLQGYSYGAPKVTLRWTVDFRENGTCPIMLIFDCSEIEDTPIEWTSKYTYDPATMTGQILNDNTLNNPTFTVDPFNRTITMNMVFSTQHEQDGPVYDYGGETILHQTH